MQDDIQKLRWLSGEGPSSFVVLSSRIRVARNLSDYPFPYRAVEPVRREILARVKQAVSVEESLKSLELVELEKLQPLDRQILLETHLVSPYFIQEVVGRGLLLDQDSTISVMINEEDHLRLQCIMSGLNLAVAWEILNRVDDGLERKLPYAFHEQWGYLAAFPTNLGTGMRASTLLHLPALIFLQALPNLIHSLNQMGMVVRGFYGEGTEAQGHFFQISNAFSIGPTEEDLVARISSISEQVMNQELEARGRLRKEHSRLIEDRVWRAFSILKSARIMNSAEAMEHLSMTRLGVHLGMLPPIPARILNELIVMTRPSNLQKKFGLESDLMKRDIMRADYLRGRLEGFG